MIELKNISKSYEENLESKLILDSISLSIPASQRIILLGASGSGKTTLLNIIGVLDKPSSGTLIINDTDVSNFNQDQLANFRRKNIGFVFQFFNLIPTLTVEENIFLPLELNDLNTKQDKEYALSLLDRVNLSHKLKSFPDKLSGGEQQRVAIVRSLAHKPSILIADEPTGNLDQESALNLISLLRTLLDETQANLIMATHSHEVLGLANRIYKVDKAKLIEFKA